MDKVVPQDKVGETPVPVFSSSAWAFSIHHTNPPPPHTHTYTHSHLHSHSHLQLCVIIDTAEEMYSPNLTLMLCVCHLRGKPTHTNIHIPVLPCCVASQCFHVHSLYTLSSNPSPRVTIPPSGTIQSLPTTLLMWGSSCGLCWRKPISSHSIPNGRAEPFTMNCRHTERIQTSDCWRTSTTILPCVVIKRHLDSGSGRLAFLFQNYLIHQWSDRRCVPSCPLLW